MSTSKLTHADRRFLAAFEDLSLPESAWTHRAHVVHLAWICLTQAAPEAALERIRRGILRYNSEVLGRRHKYHETVTTAFSRVVADRIESGESWERFAQRIEDVLDPDASILRRYYSDELLFSDRARQQFVEPDRQPLPEIDEFAADSE